jgi:hypothetical protein
MSSADRTTKTTTLTITTFADVKAITLAGFGANSPTIVAVSGSPIPGTPSMFDPCWKIGQGAAPARGEQGAAHRRKHRQAVMGAAASRQ